MRCPSISSVAWAAKALEELELEEPELHEAAPVLVQIGQDDDVFEVIAEKVSAVALREPCPHKEVLEVTDQVDELSPQETCTSSVIRSECALKTSQLRSRRPWT